MSLTIMAVINAAGRGEGGGGGDGGNTAVSGYTLHSVDTTGLLIRFKLYFFF